MPTCPPVLPNGVYHMRLGNDGVIEGVGGMFATAPGDEKAIVLKPQIPETVLHQSFNVRYNEERQFYVIMFQGLELPPFLGFDYPQLKPMETIILGSAKGFCLIPMLGSHPLVHRIIAADSILGDGAEYVVGEGPEDISPPIVALMLGSKAVWQFIPVEKD